MASNELKAMLAIEEAFEKLSFDEGKRVQKWAQMKMNEFLRQRKEREKAAGDAARRRGDAPEPPKAPGMRTEPG